MENSFKKLPFLDILIKNENGQIITVAYPKLTDTQQYLHFKSHHSKNCIKSIPYTQVCRIYTIDTNKNPPKRIACYPPPERIINKQGIRIRKNTIKRTTTPEKNLTTKNP